MFMFRALTRTEDTNQTWTKKIDKEPENEPVQRTTKDVYTIERTKQKLVKEHKQRTMFDEYLFLLFHTYKHNTTLPLKQTDKFNRTTPMTRPLWCMEHSIYCFLRIVTKSYAEIFLSEKLFLQMLWGALHSMNITFRKRERICLFFKDHLMIYQFHHSVRNNSNEKPKCAMITVRYIDEQVVSQHFSSIMMQKKK